MASNKRRKNVRQSDFSIVARGVRRPNPDISRLMKTSLDHYLTQQESAEAPGPKASQRRTP